MNKIKYILVLSVLIILFLFLGYTVSRAYINKASFEKDVLEIAEKNEEPIFSINNITLFSSCNSKSEIQSNSTLKLSNLYQYTDIAIFITPVDKNLTSKNTLKDVYIDNVNFVSSPSEGTPNLYYKNINKFATSEYSEDNKIENNLHYKISSEENEDLNMPILYNNCANPIALCYVNSNIKNDFTLPDAFSQITYDGSLLKKCGITLGSISCSFSFDIHITNNLGQDFICPVYIEIPLDLEDGTSIYDGKVLQKNNTNYTFYRLK
ncbi:MAG: hypothetical protein IKF17_04890 [Clostridia bacterium]|nr:hypothetical protein [Clostridia bacterium]